MERIKQALERARQEREESGTRFAIPASHSPSSPVVINYTHTRTVDTRLDALREKRIIVGTDNDPFTNAYKLLRTQVLQRLQEHNWKTLALVSAGAEEGRTLTAVNLAISLAMEVDCTVLLVEADLRRPNMHSLFGMEANRGLSDYLTDDVPLAELLVHPAEIPRLVLLPAGRVLTNSSEMLSSPKMIRMVTELKTRYQSRLVLFDLPPLLTTADALAFSPYVDAALLVIEEGKTKTQDIQKAMDLLKTTNVLGTVLNKSGIMRADRESRNGTKGLTRILRGIFPVSWLHRILRKGA